VFGPPYLASPYQTSLVIAGETAILGVTATNISPIAGYQWRFNGADIAGATSSTLRLFNVQTSQAGQYAVVVSNPAKSAPVSVPLTLSIATNFTSRAEARFDSDIENWQV